MKISRTPIRLQLAPMFLIAAMAGCSYDNSDSETKSVASDYAEFYQTQPNKAQPQHNRVVVNPHPYDYVQAKEAFQKMDLFNGKGIFHCYSAGREQTNQMHYVVSGTYANGKPDLDVTLQFQNSKATSFPKTTRKLHNTSKQTYIDDSFSVIMQSSNGFPEAIVQAPARFLGKTLFADKRITNMDAIPHSYLQTNQRFADFTPVKCVTRKFWDTTRTKTDYDVNERAKAFEIKTPAERGFEPIPGLKVVGCSLHNSEYSYDVLGYAGDNGMTNYKDPEIQILSKHNGIVYGPYRLRQNDSSKLWDHGAQISNVRFNLQSNAQFGSVSLSHLASDGIIRTNPTLTASGSCGSY